MDQQLYVVPRTGRKVADRDNGGHLPAEGRLVLKTTYWKRRVKDTDVFAGADRAKAEAERKRVEDAEAGKAASKHNPDSGARPTSKK